MGREETTNLHEEDVWTTHDERSEHHGVGYHLRGDGQEEEAGLLSPLVLGARVGECEDKTLETEWRV
jgi:hypothetical protein